MRAPRTSITPDAGHRWAGYEVPARSAIEGGLAHPDVVDPLEHVRSCVRSATSRAARCGTRGSHPRPAAPHSNSVGSRPLGRRRKDRDVSLAGTCRSAASSTRSKGSARSAGAGATRRDRRPGSLPGRKRLLWISFWESIKGRVATVAATRPLGGSTSSGPRRPPCDMNRRGGPCGRATRLELPAAIPYRA